MNTRQILNEVVKNIQNTDKDVLNERLKATENSSFAQTINRILKEEELKNVEKQT